MKVTKVVTLNSVEVNQVMIDFVYLVSQLKNAVKSNNVLTPADIENLIDILKVSLKHGVLSTYDIVDNISVSSVINVQD